MTSQALRSLDQGVRLVRLDRMQRWFGLIVIVPALILPMYQQFLHGGRDAPSITPRAEAYLGAHILGATCSTLLLFGLMAIYLKHAAIVGRFGLTALIVAVFGQAAWAGGLLVDGAFNSLLAIYDPVLQTNVHTASQAGASASPYPVSGLLTTFEVFFAVNVLTYLAGYLMMGAMIVRAGVMPRWIGVFLAVGALLVATSLVTPPWAESIGYVAIGAAFAWAGFLLWRRTRGQADQ